MKHICHSRIASVLKGRPLLTTKDPNSQVLNKPFRTALMNLTTRGQKELPKKKQKSLKQNLIILILVLGIIFLVVSTFYASSFLAILGAALAFWGIILSYITPTKQVPIEMLNGEAETNASNIERIINELGVTLIGIYLPPRNLQNPESSLVIIPRKIPIKLPSAEEITNKLLTKKEDSILITPPGASLCRMFEQELNLSFTKMDLSQLQTRLPKLLVENMELAENAEMQVEGNIVTVEITCSILDTICEQTQKLTHTHDQIGCTLTSAIACALAKVSGKPVTIQKETKNPQKKSTHIEYRIQGE